jgi:hypothetical protein
MILSDTLRAVIRSCWEVTQTAVCRFSSKDANKPGMFTGALTDSMFTTLANSESLYCFGFKGHFSPP